MKRHSVHREHKDICLPAQQSLWPLRELILFPVVNLFIWLLRDKFDSGRLVHLTAPAYTLIIQSKSLYEENRNPPR